MSLWEVFTAIAGGATIFALIVGIFSVWNGRMTRKEVIKAITQSQEIITKTITQSQETITKAITEMADKISQLIVADGERTRELLRKK